MSSTQTAPLRAAIYARVSSEEQREGQTIDSQIAELERFARAQDWLIAGIYKDEGWSGAVLARPELDRLRDDASRRAFDLVLINDVDRLARDVSHLGVIKRSLESHLVQVRFRKLPAEQSPTANLMVNILGSFAEFERELIADRMRRGRRHKVEVRQQFLASCAPYGYRYRTKSETNSRDGALEIVPEEALIVKQIYQWVDEEGLSAMKVLARLNERQIPTKKQKPRWGKSSVLRVLHCETYTGVWYYNKGESYEPTGKEKLGYRKTAKCRTRRRPRDEWIPVQLPKELQLLDRAQWERVQAQLARNRVFSPRNDQHQYLLKGLVRCGGCGAAYIGDPNHGKFYYRCLLRCKIYASVREEMIQDAVWEALTEALQNPSLVLSQVERRARERAAQWIHQKDEIAQVVQALAKVHQEENRLIEAYRLSILTAEMLQSQMEQLKTRKAALQQKQAEFEQAGRFQKVENVKEPVETYCRAVANRLETMNRNERQRLLQLLIERITYYGERIVIRAILPLDKHGEENNQARAFGDAGTRLSELHPRKQEVERQGTDQARPSTRNPLRFSADRVASTEVNHHDHNPAFSLDRIATTENYHEALNPVIEREEIPFELTCSLPQAKPLFKPYNLELVKRLVAQHPQATLKQLCAMVEREKGFRVAISSMHRAQIRLGLRRKDRRLQS
jgi:site-specific DNA recombinase